jgi:endonuclease/exonuclease/phosphatase family metal-dependent hydrolase
MALLCCGLMLATPAAALAELRIASWNIQHLGWGKQKDFAAVAEIASRFDFLAVQEVMSGEGIERLRDILIETTAEPWEAMYSHRLGRGQYREKYAFLWRANAVEYVDGAVVFLATTQRFAREPYSARFRVRATGFEFVAATVHIVYGRSVRDRTPEIHALREYWDWLGEVYADTPARFLMGDFNLAPHHAAWAEIWEVAEPLIVSGATTLSSIDGRYANLYDNILVGNGNGLPISGAGILRYPELLGLDHERARRTVSDHAPVYVLLGEVQLDEGERTAKLVARNAVACLDLNTAGAGELAAIVHIGIERANVVIDGRPWHSVDELRQINGIGAARLRDIREQGLVCQ